MVGARPEAASDWGEERALRNSDSHRYPRSEYDDSPPEPEPASVLSVPIKTLGELLRDHPDRRPAVIHGLLREGETMNIIAAPKLGKSWLAQLLAFDIVTGRPWLGTFETEPGRVLLIDNELHKETSAYRLRTLARRLDIPVADVENAVAIMNLRGRLLDINTIWPSLKHIAPGYYRLIILDAFYRMLPPGVDENDNGEMARVYNTIDDYAEELNSAFVNIHHTSKGTQDSKTITDVGSGAGAQSRAADTHLILRQHEQDGAAILQAVTRSWPPVAPTCLRWDFPLWTPAPDLDPEAFHKAARRSRLDQRNKPAEQAWTAERFAKALGTPEARLQHAIIESALVNFGLSERTASGLLKRAIACGHLFSWKEAGANSPTLIATVKPAPPPETAPTAAKRVRVRSRRKRARKPRKNKAQT
jgi:hypothetical protein